jgi:glycosyltransferase involved in cell wall biosynthesis
MDIGWKLRRIGHLVRRLKGSVAIRGWRGTLRRALRDRGEHGAPTAPIVVRPPSSAHAVRRILIVERMTPDPSRDSGSVRLCQIFALLNADGWQIDFIADDGDTSATDAVRLADLGVRVIHESALRWMTREGAALDAVMLCRLPMADQYIHVVRRHAPNARVLFDTVDLHFIREGRAAALLGTPSLARQARRSRERELAMVARCDVTIVVSKDEQDVLVREAPDARIEVVSNIHHVHGRVRGFSGRSGLLFVGGFGHPPNEDAVRWFATEVLPRVRDEAPGTVLHVVGDIDEAAKRRIESESVIVHGRVANLAPMHERALISVAPLRFGAGVKGKVNQAMSHGLPVVLTGIAAEGMYLRHGVDALIADSPDAFADAIVRLARDESLWTSISDAGLDNIRQYFSVENARSALDRALDNRE